MQKVRGGQAPSFLFFASFLLLLENLNIQLGVFLT